MTESFEVMVIDDEKIVGERLKDFLEKNSIHTEIFTDSVMALKRLEEKNFDVVITDLKMKEPNGLEVLLHIKKKKLPVQVILITGYGTYEDYLEAEAVGVAECVTKPFEMSAMLKLVKKTAKRARKMRAE